MDNLNHIQFVERLVLTKNKEFLEKSLIANLPVDEPYVEIKNEIIILRFSKNFQIFMEDNLFRGCNGLESLELTQCEIEEVNFELFKNKSLTSL